MRLQPAWTNGALPYNKTLNPELYCLNQRNRNGIAVNSHATICHWAETTLALIQATALTPFFTVSCFQQITIPAIQKYYEKQFYEIPNSKVLCPCVFFLPAPLGNKRAPWLLPETALFCPPVQPAGLVRPCAPRRRTVGLPHALHVQHPGRAGGQFWQRGRDGERRAVFESWWCGGGQRKQHLCGGLCQPHHPESNAVGGGDDAGRTGWDYWQHGRDGKRRSV